MGNNHKKTEKLRQFLKDRPAISVNCIEMEAKILGQAVAKAKGGRDLNDEQWEKLLPVLKKYGWK